MSHPNRSYRIVWSEHHQSWVVASEISKGKSKSSTSSVSRLARIIAAGLGLVAALSATANTINGFSVQGSPVVTVAAGDTYTNATIQSGGTLVVAPDAVATGSLVNNGGEQDVANNGLATDSNVQRGGYVYVSGGGRTSHSILNGGMQTVAGGMAVATEINSGGRQTLLAGAESIGTRLNDYGMEMIQSGARATSPVVNSGGIQTVFAGGMTSNAMLGNGGWQLLSGGTTSNTVMDQRSVQGVYTGGTAIGTQLGQYGNQYVIGGLALATVMNGGNQLVSDDGRSVSAILNSGATQNVSSGGRAENTVVNGGGSQLVSNGGLALATSVGSGGQASVLSGGVANAAIVSGYAALTVSSGGLASGTQIRDLGGLYLNGGTISATTVGSNAAVAVSGGLAVGTVVNGGVQSVSGGGRTSGTVLNGAGYEYVFAGTAVGTAVNAGGWQAVYSGGMGSATQINGGGQQSVFSDGRSVDAVVAQSAVLYVFANGAADNVMVSSGGSLRGDGVINTATLNGGSNDVFRLGSTDNVTINRAGLQLLSGQARNTTVNADGWQIVSSGGRASATTVNSGGTLSVVAGGNATAISQQSGAILLANTNGTLSGSNSMGVFSVDAVSHVASNVLLENGGTFDVLAAGNAGNTVVNSGGTLNISASGVANATTVNSVGIAVISSGGVANSTVINNSGNALLLSAGIASASIINDGGTLLVADGGTLQGLTRVNGSGTLNGVIINQGEIRFDQNNDSSFTGVVSGSGSLRKRGSGTLTLAAAHRYSGNTTVDGGVLKAGAANVLPASALTLQSGTQFDMGGFDQSVASLAGSGNVSMGANQLTLGQNGSVDNSTAVFSGALNGSGNLLKTGNYTQVLSGELAYGGLTQINAGTLVLDGSKLFGDVVGISGSHLILQNGATLTGSIDPLDVTVSNGSTWTVTANSLVDTLTVGGHVDMAAPSAALLPKQLTAVNLVGSGGRITLNTALAGNASLTDKIIINGGQASGNTTLAIRNAGGLGAQTSGDGILLVDAVNGGTTTANAFALDAPVLAGAYEYTLHRGGVSDGQDWFLTSQKTDSGSSQPNYRAEVSLDSVVPSLALEYGSTVLGSLNERRAAPGGERVWSRIVAQETRHGGAASGVLAGDARYQSDLYLTQVGGDLYQQQQNGIDDRAGVYGAIGQSAARVDHHDGRGAGKVTLDGYSIGAYWTRSSDQGWYGDSVLQATWNDVKSRSANNLQLESDGMSWLASVEGGYRRQLDNGVLVEPQLQLAYQQLKLADGRDSAANVGFDRSDSLRTRLSVRVARDWKLGEARTLRAWLRPGLLHESKGHSQTRFMTSTAPTVAVQSPLAGTSLQLLAGVQGQVGKQSSVNLKASYETRLSGGTHDKYGVQLGVNTLF